MKNVLILVFFLISQNLFSQVLIPFSFFKGNAPFSVTPSGTIYVLADTSTTFTAFGGMGVYDWSITGPASADGAAVIFTDASDPTADYDTRVTAYTTDTLTVTSPGYTNITRTIATYDPLSINPTTATVGVNLTQSFTGAGGCLNGTNCSGGSRIFSVVSGTGSINSSTGLFTASGTTGTTTVQVIDSIGNIATATITITNNLTMTPSNLKISIYSTGVFSTILGTTPYAYSILSGTGTLGCQGMLTAAHTNVVTTITVDSTTGCPNLGTIRIGTETICYTAKTATTFTNATRGCNATTAAAYVITTPYNSTQTVYTASTMIGAATVRVTDSTLPIAGVSDSAITIIKPIDIKAGQYFACALHDEGSVKCWGNNSNGQLGLGSTTTIGDIALEIGGANNFVNLGTGRTATIISTGLTHA